MDEIHNMNSLLRARRQKDERQESQELPNLAAYANCRDEPIRVPGSIQRHGFFLALDELAQRVVVASENAEEFLGVPLKLVLGARLDAVLPREVVSVVGLLHSSARGESATNYLGAFLIKGELYSVVTHCIGATRVLELEQQDRLVSAELMNNVITNFAGVLSKVPNSIELCRSITRQVQQLAGCDRVMLYSFDDTGAGTVIAEENNGKLPSYLDLRFPGTDIPQQARELYLLNTVRIIPDATYVASPLIGISGEDARTLDLSLSTLRSVSPIHLEYMRNMGTLSSMSISIVCEGKLWGLISGHHATPYRVPYLIRSACDMLSKLGSTQITSFGTSERLERAVHFHAVQRGLLTQIAVEKNYVSSLTALMGTLRQITEADGVALSVNGEWVVDGTTPAAAALARIAEWLDGKKDTNLFVTRKLSEHVSWGESIRNVASGIVAIRISDVNRRYVMWFRREVVETVKWAGEPAKSEYPATHLHPRASFAAWKETVRGQSVPWTDAEIQSAADFRSALVTVSLHRAEEEAELSEARFHQLTQTLPTKIFTTNDAGELTLFNKHWTQDGLVEHGRWFDNGNVTEADVDRCRAAWERAVAEGAEFQEEIRLRGANGVEQRWHFVHAVPIKRIRAADRAGWVASCTDLTERHEREAAQRMAEKLALTSRMTSVIAHEINNPLSSITNLMYLLRSEVPQQGRAISYVEMVDSELLRISAITKQTLRWSRENTGNKEWSTARTLFDDMLRLFAGKIRNREVAVEINAEEKVPYFGVIGQIRQVVANLLSNAVDAAHVGGNVVLRASAENGYTVFEVTDDGVGMDAQTQAQLFKPFFSTKGDLGNGLGLYISQEILERHGAQVEVNSVLGKGTTIRVKLPLPA